MTSEFTFPTQSQSARARKGKAAPPPQDEMQADQEPLLGDTQAPPAAAEYSEEELMAIFDSLMFTSEYSETFLLRGKLEVIFRTRSAKEANLIQSHIDKAGFNLISTVEQTRAMRMLSTSLVGYNGQDLSTVKAEDKEAFVSKLPVPVVGALIDLLSKFDRKVEAACKAGEQNF